MQMIRFNGVINTRRKSGSYFGTVAGIPSAGTLSFCKENCTPDTVILKSSKSLTY